MPPITLSVRILLGIVAAVAGVFAGILGNVLAINIVYKLTGRGRRPTERPLKIWLLFYGSAAISILFGTVVALAPEQSEPGTTIIPESGMRVPFAIDIEGSKARILDRNDKELWSINVRGMISQAVIEDLDGDTTPEVIVGVTERDTNVNNPGADSGKLVVYLADGHLWWELSLVDFAPYAINQGGRTGTVVVQYFLVADLGGDASKEIVVLTRDLMWYPSKLTIIGDQGIVGSEYWHPGFIYDVKVARSHEDGQPLLVARGVNNDLAVQYNDNPSAVFVLDPSDLFGQAPPYYFAGIEKGTHLWYGTVPRPAAIRDIQIRDVLDGSDLVVVEVDECFLYVELLTGKIKTTALGSSGATTCASEFHLHN